MHEGKVVIITGSGGGIGRYVAKTFARQRAKVVVSDIKPLDNVSKDLEEAEAEYLAIPADVTNVDSVRNLVDTVMDKYGRIDVLDNNAAIVTHFQWGTGVWPRIAELDPAFWDKVIRTNLGGCFNCTRYVLPHMEAQRSGHIINMMGGSNAVGGSPYQVSKTAIAQFTHHIALEERDYNICAVAIGPNPPGITGIATEDAPAEARARMRNVDVVGDRFVIAATAPMEFSGKRIDVREDGTIVALD
ncbi:MAG TPA: SDR family NAD(P)-dependent oxidoreductase [Chloroflexota bacterium]|nr:SDR family NAD(P)-dependent oxidoreductase [Chloroflexota bacterium]